MSAMLLAVSWKFLFSLSCAKCIQRKAPETECFTECVQWVLEEICFSYLAGRMQSLYPMPLLAIVQLTDLNSKRSKLYFVSIFLIIFWVFFLYFLQGFFSPKNRREGFFCSCLVFVWLVFYPERWRWLLTQESGLCFILTTEAKALSCRLWTKAQPLPNHSPAPDLGYGTWLWDIVRFKPNYPELWLHPYLYTCIMLRWSLLF